MAPKWLADKLDQVVKQANHDLAASQFLNLPNNSDLSREESTQPATEGNSFGTKT